VAGNLGLYGLGGLGANPAHQGELLGITNRFNGQVNIQLGPVEVIGSGAFHMKNFPNRGILKPWELCKRKEKLLTPQQQPKAVL
jgi:hypothetical protein